MLVTSLLYGIYMGIVAFFVPVIIPVYSFYMNVEKGENIGKHIFIGRFLAYALVFSLIFLQLGDFLRSDLLAFILNISSIVLCTLIIIKIIRNLLKKDDNDNIGIYDDEDAEYQDINEAYYASDELDTTNNRQNRFSISFLASLLLTLSSTKFIYWCDFSVLSIMLKINYKDEGMGLLYILLFAFSMLLMLLLLDVLFSKLAKVLSKYISKLIKKPFAITVVILFVAYIVYIVCNMPKFNVF